MKFPSYFSNVQMLELAAYNILSAYNQFIHPPNAYPVQGSGSSLEHSSKSTPDGIPVHRKPETVCILIVGGTGNTHTESATSIHTEQGCD